MVQDDQGKLFNVPSENAHLALRAGYSYAPTDYVERKDLERKAAESPGTAAAFGALRGLTFGLSDGALQLAGYTPEEITAYRDQNPIATAAGEIGSLVFPFGLTSLPRGAARAASSLTARAETSWQRNQRTPVGIYPKQQVVKGAAGAAGALALDRCMPTVITFLVMTKTILLANVYAGAGFEPQLGPVGALSTVLTTGAGKFKRLQMKRISKRLI